MTKRDWQRFLIDHYDVDDAAMNAQPPPMKEWAQVHSYKSLQEPGMWVLGGDNASAAQSRRF